MDSALNALGYMVWGVFAMGALLLIAAIVGEK